MQPHLLTCDGGLVPASWRLQMTDTSVFAGIKLCLCTVVELSPKSICEYSTNCYLITRNPKMRPITECNEKTNTDRTIECSCVHCSVDMHRNKGTNDSMTVQSMNGKRNCCHISSIIAMTIAFFWGVSSLRSNFRQTFYDSLLIIVFANTEMAKTNREYWSVFVDRSYKIFCNSAIHFFAPTQDHLNAHCQFIGANEWCVCAIDISYAFRKLLGKNKIHKLE